MYVAKGLDRELAAEVARQIHADVDNAVSVHAREELGVDPDDLASPMVAAGSSFLAFAVGRAAPAAALPPRRRHPAAGSRGDPGRAVRVRRRGDRLTSRSWWYGGLRQMLLGGAAAAA